MPGVGYNYFIAGKTTNNNAQAFNRANKRQAVEADKITHQQMLFAEGISEEVEQIFTAHQEQIWDEMTIPQDCGHASYLWGQLFREKLPEVQIEYVSGSYLGGLDPEVREDVINGSSPPGATEHVWLQIDGLIFDPTAGQFSPVNGYWQRRDYLPDQARDIDQVIAEEAEIFAAEQQELQNID